MNAENIRMKIRTGEHTEPTSGISGDKVQANLVILPKEYAFDFLLFALRNSKPVPIIEVLEAGEFTSRYAQNSDIRTDVPLYNIYKKGKLTNTVSDIKDEWQDDFVTFLIGCSFTFEQAILDAGINIKHIDEGRNVAMYKTNIETVPAGIFSGETVVSMRPFKKELVDKVINITNDFPNMHGGPVHVGNPQEIGIENIDNPDYGDSIAIADDEVPVFWACGVTPQNAVLKARPEILISHAPGHMFITDINNEEYKN